ncbi:uncharacterized protein RAG0_00668 [Rhynchosporium agropyri]|uniref:Uncharacterized protein n=1 Tax=Rhynchosporium agropyri TaxID=914238 RepID=A0A1E1JUB8_9HELO|nr:uncharacterized protein RAG0_00668 [Rhynchosporium agropyri]
MRLRSSTNLERAETSASKAEGNMEEDNDSTRAVWGSPMTQSHSPEHHCISPSPPLGEAGPSNPAPAHSHRGQQSYAESHHPGEDFLLYDSWRDDRADAYGYEEHGISSQSPHTHSQSDPEPYDTSNAGSQPPPPAVPSPPPNDYRRRTANEEPENRDRRPTPLQTLPPIQRWTRDRGAWSTEAPVSAERRRDMLTKDVPDLDSKRDMEYDDKMQTDLSKLAEEGRKRKRARGRKSASSPDYRQGKRRDRDSDRDRDRRGGQQGTGQAV